jgi:hypothetical protein
MYNEEHLKKPVFVQASSIQEPHFLFIFYLKVESDETNKI